MQLSLCKDKYGPLLCLLSERQISQISRVRSQHPFHDIGIIVMEMGGFVITIVTQSPHSLSRSSSPASSVSSPLTGTMQFNVKLSCLDFLFTLTTIDWAPCLPAYAECTLLAFYVLQQLKRENQRWQQYCLWKLTDIASLSLMWDERFKVSGGFKFSNKGDSMFSNPIFGIFKFSNPWQSSSVFPSPQLDGTENTSLSNEVEKITMSFLRESESERPILLRIRNGNWYLYESNVMTMCNLYICAILCILVYITVMAEKR